MGGSDFSFDAAFEGLTGFKPLSWQRRLFEDHFAAFDRSAPNKDTLPHALDIPTGLGKTSVMDIWLLALAAQAAHGSQVKLPRRLVFVVNRRTVVDQATDRAMGLRNKLREAQSGKGDEMILRVRKALSSLCVDPDEKSSPLAISTLRGELADNREWQGDPARPAIIVGTVDMIGSRLLFSGYGASRRMRPFHAGLLGHDVLLVHDEAHLTPAFGKLVRELASRQSMRGEPRPLRVMELSATRRRTDGGAPEPFGLSPEEESEPEIARRLCASKTLTTEESAVDEDNLPERLSELALAYREARKRVVVYVRSPKHAKAVAGRLRKVAGKERVELLTGTIRGYERDGLVHKDLFKGFRPSSTREHPAQTEYLVATSAGEVGIDLDADHMVCDLATLDSMIQRLGRVNRLGRGDAMIRVVEAIGKRRRAKAGDEDGDDDGDARLAATRAALLSLPTRDGGHDASPQALRALAGRTEAFSKPPRIVPLTDILIDAWSMTRLEQLPGRSPPERWLHGVTAEAPSVYVAWREEVDAIGAIADGEAVAAAKTLFDRHPVLSRERVRGNRDDVLDELKTIAKRLGDRKVILLPARGGAEVDTLDAFLRKDKEALSETTFVLPPDVGGLDEGMLDGGTAERVPDVADRPLRTTSDDGEEADASPRMRVLLEKVGEAEEWSVRVLGQERPNWIDDLAGETSFRAALRAMRDHVEMMPMREKGRIVLATDEDGKEAKVLLLFARRGSIESAEASQDAGEPIELKQHNDDVRRVAESIVSKLDLAGDPVGEAVVLAAERHDNGKDRPGWQRAIGNTLPRDAKPGTRLVPLAKSNRRGFDDAACGRYRHEFGSLREAANVSDTVVSAHAERDLILHLIAAHHGWARPHFEPGHWDIAADAGDEDNAALAAETMRRFARLQRRFGHWGLAWLEALMRSADYRASAQASAKGDAADDGAAP